MAQSNQKCGHAGQNWNGEGDCITCARDKVLGMAQSNGDELEKILEGMYHAAHTDGLNNIFKPEPKVKRYKALILADRKQHELEARIEEADRAFFVTATHSKDEASLWHEKRIAELKAERERLGN